MQSNASPPVVHHPVYPCPLLKLHLENLELRKQDWDLVLDDLHFSILKKPKLSGSNIPSSEKSRVVLGNQFQQLTVRINGSLRKKQHDRGQGRSSMECVMQ